ncbi:hypothetical protein HPB49_002776 [Dermacentor silvarum]|uniref:Uncharacterized protein n=1 Tax=Dermacentor silvarum TaxID=543639 RepID=A0ACB8DAT6_DERSI|nr:hypothetical protein HPB49_002776 [Dermacentor silvarum]
MRLLSAHAHGLNEPARSRYENKVRLRDCVDPLELEDGLRREVGLLPRVDLAEIKDDYLVHATSFVTREELKAYKSMEGHNYLTSRWLQQLCVKVRADSMVVVGKVRHSQSFNEKPLTPWLLVKDG